MRLMTNDELVAVAGGIDKVIIRGTPMTDDEKREYDEQQEREAADTFRRERRDK